MSIELYALIGLSLVFGLAGVVAVMGARILAEVNEMERESGE
jgi:hypothetical protein